jgi:hypothetical protein
MRRSYPAYRRVHGELLTLAITLAPSTVGKILREAGMDPAPDRAAATWAAFLACQAEALLAADFIEPSRRPGRECTSWRSSSTPAAVCASSPRQPTRARRG